MPNEIPNAQRLSPSDNNAPKQPDPGIPFIAKVAVIAVPIVVGGILLALRVRHQVGVLPNAALNDTRSPLAEEISQPEANTDAASNTDTTATAPPTATGTDAPFDIDENVPREETYPEIDPDKAPLAVAVNPAISGISDSEKTPQTATSSSSSPASASYGHLPYTENDATRLSSAGSFIRENYEREETLDFEAAQAFELMRQAAKIEGVNLMPVSGFRTIADQKELFNSQINRKGSAEAAAVSSAPPGHSEHHTGYAIDITDADQPETDIKHSFENTPAYQWLIANAHMYGFEESFPKNNHQGVTFEPWHWRYVGSARAQATFSEARQLYPSR